VVYNQEDSVVLREDRVTAQSLLNPVGIGDSFPRDTFEQVLKDPELIPDEADRIKFQQITKQISKANEKLPKINLEEMGLNAAELMGMTNS
jgi:hypothetical protein